MHELIDLERKAVMLRSTLLRMIYEAGGGHTGGSLSTMEILTSLYFHTMKHDPQNPHWADRDRFILSKGHSVEGYYCVLAEAGYFPKEELKTYGRFNSRLYGHPTMKVPGVEMPTGSLGHGLSAGVGMAIAAKRFGGSYRVFVLMGDGEQAEGSIWEAAMAASHYGLDNLIGIIDYNHLQISGDVDRVMRTSSLRAKWESFGWSIHEAPGHDVKLLCKLFDALPDKPHVPHLVIANTTKGKGVSFIENNPAWHHRVPSSEEYEQAQRELSAQLKELQ